MATQKVDFDVLAHDKASDKLDRIARSFRKLKHDSDNIDGDGLTDLSKKLRKVADDFEKEGNRAGKGFGSGLKKWVTGAGADLGKEGGTVFGSGFLGAIKTPILGPALIAILGGAVATAAPAVGAIAGAGVVAGFGAGLAGLGVVFAAKSVAVKNSWNRTLTAMGADMRILSAPFEKTLLAMSGVARRTFDRFKPDLEAAFKTIAPALTEFGDDLGRAFEGLAPAIRPLSQAFAEVLKSLGPATQDAVRNISAGLQNLANSVKASPNGLSDLVKGFGDLTRTLTDGIATLNNINGAFENLTGGFSLVDGVFKGLNYAVGSVFGPFKLLESAMAATGVKARDMNSTVAISAETTKLWTQGLNAAQVAAVGTGGATDVLKPKVEALAAKFERQWQATQKANEALFRMQNLALGLSGAQINFQAAVDGATQSVKDNGKTLDINTEKGRANKTALNNVAQAANQQTEAMRNAGDGNVKAAKHAEGARANFVKLAMQMGATKPQAEAMARSMIAIPNVSRTAKLNANKKDLETKLAAAKRELASKDLTKERRATLNATIAKLQAGIAAAKAALASVPSSKTVTITTRHVTERIVRNQTATGGGRAPGFAGGGLIPGTPSSVDNHLRPMATGEFVVKASQARQNLPLLEAINDGRRPTVAAGASTVVLKIESGGSRMDDLIVEMLRRYVRVNGGDVQAVLGR